MDADVPLDGRSREGMIAGAFRASALVVKWISHRPPEPGVEVRFLSGALSMPTAAGALDLPGAFTISARY
jgi:hypothetical protein